MNKPRITTLAEAMGEVPDNASNLKDCIGYSLSMTDIHKDIAATNQRKVKPNPYVSDFITIIERVLSFPRRTVQFSEIVRENQAYELPVETVLRPLWNKWVDTMISLNKLERMNSIYDEEVFLLV